MKPEQLAVLIGRFRRSLYDLDPGSRYNAEANSIIIEYAKALFATLEDTPERPLITQAECDAWAIMLAQGQKEYEEKQQRINEEARRRRQENVQ